MMPPRHVLVDLPKDSRPEVYCFGLAAKEAKPGAFHLLGKSKLSSRRNAHRHCGILRCGKPSCTGPEVYPGLVGTVRSQGYVKGHCFQANAEVRVLLADSTTRQRFAELGQDIPA